MSRMKELRKIRARIHELENRNREKLKKTEVGSLRKLASSINPPSRLSIYLSVHTHTHTQIIGMRKFSSPQNVVIER